MALQKQNIDIPLAVGLNTRDDAKLLPPAKLLDVQNSVFSKGGALKKRNGYTALSQSTLATSPATISSATLLATRGDELVLADGTKLYGYAEQVDRWLDRGSVLLVDVGLDTVSNEIETQTCADHGTANNISVYAWENEITVSTRTVRYSVIDSLTGAQLQAAASLGSNLKAPRVLVIGSIILIVVHDTSANDLKVKRLDTSSAANLATSLGSSLIALGYSDIHDTGDFHAYSNGTYGIFAVRTTGAGTPIRVGVLLSTGAVGANADGYGNAATGPDQANGGGTYGPIAIHLNASNVGLLAWDDDETVKTVAVTNIVSGSGSITFGTARTVEAVGAAVARITCLADTTTDNGHVWYTTGAAGGTQRTKYAYTTAGVLSNQTDRYRVELASHAFYVGATPYVNLYYQSPKTYVLCDKSFLPHARCHAGVSYSYLSQTPANTRPRSPLPGVTSSYHWAAAYQRRLSGATSFTYTEPSVSRVRFSTSDSVSAAEFRGVLLLGSGQLWQYDGVSATEVGFISPPVALSATASNGAGSLSSDGSYSYAAYWEWFDSFGNREFSTSTGAFSVTMGASDDTVTLTFQALPLTHKTGSRSDPVLALYRNELNGTVRYRVSSQNPASALFLENDPTASSLSFTDTVSDGSLVLNELDPYNANDAGLTQLDAVPPPALKGLHVSQDRVWGVSRENPRRIYYTKLPQAETSVEFNDGLYVELEEDATAVADILGRPVFFSADHVYVMDGEGPDNNGVGSYSRVEQLPAGVGCYVPATLVETPLGWVFQSRKGFRILSPSFQVPSDWGNEVETYASQTFTGAELIPHSNTFRVLTSSGSSLCYDFERQQWSRFTGHTGVSSTVWDGAYCYVTSAGVVYKEASGTYTHAGGNIAQVLETSWIKPSTIQGFGRIYFIHLLLSWKSSHTATLEIAYDFEDAYSETVTITPTAAVVAGTLAYQIRHKPIRQKCNAIKFRLTEVPGTGAGLEINALSLKVGIKAGANRLGDRTI